jgi:hypothetical protein
MSDVSAGASSNPHFFGINMPWWMGRVESKETWSDNIQGQTFNAASEIEGWSHRYKVRVFNWHSGDTDKLKPAQLAMCQVLMPVTAGSGHGGAAQTPSIESGSVVFGFFTDISGQEGYIIGLLPNSNNNVPKERGEPAPNQSSTKPTPGGGAPTVSKPPTPPTGPGSLANQPVPSSVDQLSTDQLKKLLDPSKTPSSAVFKAASEVRQKAKAQGLPQKEIERLVLVATVKASKQPGADAGANANCNKGYQQFNNTYSDGSEERSAKVPDNLILGGIPLSTTEALHIFTEAWTSQDKDKKKRIPLSDVSKKNNSDMKGIQRTLKNLINTVEDLKKKYNQVSAFVTDVSEFSGQIEKEIGGAVTELSGFTKNIMGGVRGYTLTKLSDGVKKAAPNLFPSEIPKLYQKVEEGMSALNCAFNNITANMPNLLKGSLNDILDKTINTPMCAVEQLMSKIMDGILGQITGILDTVFSSINAILGSVSGALGAVGGALGAASGALGAVSGAAGALGAIGDVGGSLFNALDYEAGIKKFFSCDETEKPVKYNEISLDRAALPGGDAVKTPTPDGGAPTGTGDSSASSANIVNSANTAPDNTGIDQALEDSKANKPPGRNDLELI